MSKMEWSVCEQESQINGADLDAATPAADPLAATDRTQATPSPLAGRISGLRTVAHFQTRSDILPKLIVRQSTVHPLLTTRKT